MTSYTTITSDNVSSAVRDNIRALLEDYITDPTNAEKRHMIYERPPHAKASDFDEYPVVILSNYGVESESGEDTVNGYHSWFDVTFTIEVEVEEENPEHLDAIADDVVNIIKGQTAAEQVDEHGLDLRDIVRDEKEPGINEDENFIIRRTIEGRGRVRVDMGA